MMNIRVLPSTSAAATSGGRAATAAEDLLSPHPQLSTSASNSPWMRPEKATAQGHHTSWTSGEEDEDIDPLVDQQGCGRVYSKLEVCLGENDRDWRLCQAEVQALKTCYQKAAAVKQEGSSSGK